MSPRYAKYYDNNHVVAYGRETGAINHLFVWVVNEAPDAPSNGHPQSYDSLDALLDDWNDAADPEPFPYIERSVFFCQRFDPKTIYNALYHLAGHGIGECWGKLTYWRESVFTGQIDTSVQFPTYPADSPHIPITIGDVSLTLDPPDGVPPLALDHFNISRVSPAGFSPQDGLSLELKLDHISWSVDGVGNSRELVVWLDDGGDFTAGAIGLPITSPNDAAHSPPLQRTKIMFLAKPSVSPGGPQLCRMWGSRIVSSVKPSGSNAAYYILLDLRDSEDSPDWMAGELNSRLLFGASEIHSTLFSAKGSPFSFTGALKAAARFAFLNDWMDDDGTMSSDGKVTFHPEGHFTITSPVKEVSGTSVPLNIYNCDLLAGATATEFFDAASATYIEFVKRQPAFFLENDKSGKLFDDSKKSDVFTSYIRFSDGKKAITTDFHSQAAEAPLFEIPPDPDLLQHLRRRRQKYGSSDQPLPVFFHAGYEAGTDDYAGIVGFETTHLSRYRRDTAKPPPVLPKLLVDPQSALGVTQQGILAEITADGLFSKLFFGCTDGGTSNPEFCLSIIAAPNNPFYADVQQALAASQLFMVISDPAPGALDIIQPSAVLYATDFAFTITSEKKLLNATEMAASAFLIKYVKDKSLDVLVQDTNLWSCKAELAPNATAIAIKNLTGLGPKPGPSDPDLKPLDDVWFDKNWQGILILGLPVPLDQMPPILQALGPGFYRPDNTSLPKLNAPYFGINALAATKKDLVPAHTPRPGSVFGLIKYDQPVDPKSPPDKPIYLMPPAPDMGDHEPGATELPPPAPPPRSYALAVRDLRVGFANSQIASFEAQVTIDFSHLFWDPLSKPPQLLLVGSYERRGTEDIFSLVCKTPIVFSFDSSSYLKQLTITRAQLSVVSSDTTSLTAFIGIDGTLVLSEKLTHLPLFSVKSINLSSFGFSYNFNKLDFSGFSFGFKPGGLSAEIDFTPGSLSAPPFLSFLPVKLKGMSISLGDLLDLSALHFTPFNFGGSAIGTKFHFAFLMELDFGSLGGLAGDPSGMRIPLLLGWGGGQNKGLAFGIQFPSFNAPIDIGIQQFIRLQADRLEIQICPPDAQQNLSAVGIEAINARAVFLGQAWPQVETTFAIFVPLHSGRSPSWAFGLKNDPWYVGGGYRITLPASGANTVRSILSSFMGDPTFNKSTSVCDLLGFAANSRDEWSIVASYSGELDVAVAISDPSTYGINVVIDPFGGLDVLYRRVSNDLGIFSLEYSLPGPARTMQFGAASVTLPVFRLEIHTDGGFLADFGFPWNNDFSRSCQVEVAIFLGSGGFYFGITSAAATDLLNFEGGYGFSPPDVSELGKFHKTVRLGFAARVGIGRSFTIGILDAAASLTIFGGVEGAAAYQSGADLFSPTLYAVKGYVGLMVDISATVNFAIIRASVRILAYAEVGFEIRRLLAKSPTGEHHLIRPPLFIFADISINITVVVEIHIGCVDIPIYLSFSANWHYEETLSSFQDDGTLTGAIAATARFGLAAPPFTWNPNYRYWSGMRPLTVYATVLPCMADAADVGQTGDDDKTCAVGIMLLPVQQQQNGFGDFAKFLLGWLLLYDVDPTQYESYPLTLGRVTDFQTQIRDPNTTFWKDFAPALLTVVKNQFAVQLQALQNGQGQTESFTAIPPWPDSTFEYVRAGLRESGDVAIVTVNGTPVSASDQAFADYCRHLIGTTLPEIRQLIDAPGTPNDTSKSMKWSDIWLHMFDPLTNPATARR
jgi:hypothetical protein